MRTTDRDEFDEFVRTRATALLRTAYALTGNHHAAEDLLQDVLERMFVHWRRINEAPEAYAHRALVNRACSRWRWRRRRPETRLVDADQAGVLPDGTDEVVRRSVLIDALRTLPPRQRAAIVLRYLDDLPVSAVAQALGCAEGSVRSHTARGLAKLREALGAHRPTAAVSSPAARNAATPQAPAPQAPAPQAPAPQAPTPLAAVVLPSEVEEF